jgi:hypothetical protein
MAIALRTTALSILREPLSFDKKSLNRFMPRARTPICKMCNHSCERPFMRLYNQFYEETVHTCSERCYEAFMKFYISIAESKREIEYRDKYYRERFNITYDKSKEQVERSLWAY